MTQPEIAESWPIPDTFCQEVAIVERLGPCTRITFAVDRDADSETPWRGVVCKIVVPTENLRAIAAAILAAASGQTIIPEPTPAGAARH